MGLPNEIHPLQLGASSGGYQIEQSLRFDGSAYLNRTPASDTSSNKKGTFSCWMKIGSNSGTNGGTFIGAADTFHYGQFYNQSFYFGNTSSYISTAALVRDHSAWYHVVFVFDTTLATANDRMIIYVNGSRQATGTFNTQPSQNSSFTFLNTAQAYNIGRRPSGNYFNGYLAEVNFIDSQALTPSSFGETDTITGAWIPKKYSGSYGTNGFYLKFESSGIGTDSSGNSNTWTANNFSTSGTGTDVMSDTPTNNYATLNPLETAAQGVLANGNLEVAALSNLLYRHATIYIPSSSTNKFYWEVNYEGGPNYGIGIKRHTPGGNEYGDSIRLQETLGTNATIEATGIFAGFTTVTAPSTTTTAGDIIGVAYDPSAGTIKWTKNGSTFAEASGLTSADVVPFAGRAASAGVQTSKFIFNFGQRAFAYTPPTGFKALNTQNSPEPTIKKGGEYFNTVLYTGNNTTRTITGVGFQPDLVWFKTRSTIDNHALFNAVVGATTRLSSNLTLEELSDATTLTSFNTDGFSLGTDGGGLVNASGVTYVAWNWKANGAGSSNTAGTITSTVSANATAGFSIVTYTGTGANATVGHGLGVTPKMVIVKSRTQTGSQWVIYNSNLTDASYYLLLNTTDGQQQQANVWNSTAPTSTVFSVGTAQNSNKLNENLVAYCFSEVAGYSKFGSYTGNGSSDGVFIHLGFKPAFFMWKVTSTTGSWGILDFKRDTYNVSGKQLFPNQSDAEASYTVCDLLSNGIKMRNTFADTNGSGSTYVYAAFAELPSKYSNAR